MSPSGRGAPAAGGCRLEVVDDPEVFERLAPEWTDLLGRAAEPNVYLTPAWAGAWWRTFGAGPRRHASRSTLHVVVVRRGERLVGLLPLLEAQIGAPPLGIRMLAVVGSENADFGGVLVDPSDLDALGTIVEHLLHELGRGRTVVNLTRLEERSALVRALALHMGPRFALREEQHEEYPFLDLRALDDPERQVRKLLKRNDVPRRTRRLSEQGEVGWVWNHPDPAAGLADFLHLHDLRWEGRAPSGPFVSAPGRRFLADASRGLHEAGHLRTSFVTLDGTPIVGRFGTVFGGRYQGMKSGWDPAFATFGPGHMVVGRIIEQALADGLDGFDFMRGAGEHKAAWTNDGRAVAYWSVGRDDRLASVDHRALWGGLALRYRWRGRPKA